MLTGHFYKVEVKSEIVFTCNLGSEHLSCNEEVSQIGLGVGSVNKRCTIGIDVGEVISPFAVTDINNALLVNSIPCIRAIVTRQTYQFHGQ